MRKVVLAKTMKKSQIKWSYLWDISQQDRYEEWTAGHPPKLRKEQESCSQPGSNAHSMPWVPWWKWAHGAQTILKSSQRNKCLHSLGLSCFRLQHTKYTLPLSFLTSYRFMTDNKRSVNVLTKSFRGLRTLVISQVTARHFDVQSSCGPHSPAE